MCSKAEEIQKQWKPADGDFYYDKQGLKPVNIWTNWSCTARNDRYWLPRQDQLQEISISKKAQYLNGFNINLIEMFYRFNCTVYRNAQTPMDIFTSMEQIWLAYLMKIKYHKKWDGSEWIAERG